MNAVVDYSVVLKDVRGALSADTLKDSGGGDFVIGQEGPGSCEGIDFFLHRGPICWRRDVLMARRVPCCSILWGNRSRGGTQDYWGRGWLSMFGTYVRSEH